MLRQIVASLFIVMSMLAVSITALPAKTYAAVDPACQSSFIGLPTWYKYLDVGPENGDDCAIKGPRENGKFAWEKAAGYVAIAVVEAMLRIAALVAVIFVIYGGFRFITSQGEPENSKAARETVINALIGLVLAIAAAGIVSFIAGTLTS